MAPSQRRSSRDESLDVTSHDDAFAGSDLNSNKRKRDTTQASEIEIDVSLPEPPSKKALRRAKRENPAKSSDGSGNDSQTQPLPYPDRDADPISEELHLNGQTAATSTKPEPSPYSVWIGNLPFTVTKAILRTFLTSTSANDLPLIPDATITRIHIPAPTDARTKGPLKPQNKGFAYVDLATEPAFNTAIALSESPFGARRVLIKSPKDFTGRPDKPSAADGTSNADSAAHADAKSKKQPMRRVFVGNLGFDVTREDLQSHFAVCGGVDDIFMATFEDTGKCKGFAWVTFESIEAATDAVRGFTYVTPSQDEAYDQSDASEAAEETTRQQPQKKKPKPRKWFINRLHGRTLRCEFAEDPETRYKKRFSKNLSTATSATPRKGGKSFTTRNEQTDASEQPAIEEVDDHIKPSPAKSRTKSNGSSSIRPGAPTDPNRRRGRAARDHNAPDSYSVKYRTGGITESTGTKITFD